MFHQNGTLCPLRALEDPKTGRGHRNTTYGATHNESVAAGHAQLRSHTPWATEYDQQQQTTVIGGERTRQIDSITGSRKSTAE